MQPRIRVTRPHPHLPPLVTSSEPRAPHGSGFGLAVTVWSVVIAGFAVGGLLLRWATS